jgi:hypothetical protein
MSKSFMGVFRIHGEVLNKVQRSICSFTEHSAFTTNPICTQTRVVVLIYEYGEGASNRLDSTCARKIVMVNEIA